MKKGFTLIELLVVIAIIGILTSIILVSVNKATNKAKDVAIQADLHGLVAAATLYNNEKNTYEGFCTSTDAVNAFNGIKSQYPANADRSYCNAEEFAWVACGQLLATDSAWCIDASGNGKAITKTLCVSTWNATSCP